MNQTEYKRIEKCLEVARNDDDELFEAYKKDPLNCPISPQLKELFRKRLIAESALEG